MIFYLPSPFLSPSFFYFVLENKRISSHLATVTVKKTSNLLESMTAATFTQQSDPFGLKHAESEEKGEK